MGEREHHSTEEQISLQPVGQESSKSRNTRRTSNSSTTTASSICSKVLECIRALNELIILLLDVMLVIVCAVFHFRSSVDPDKFSFAWLTIVIFFNAGITTNIFHCLIHEGPHLRTASTKQKLIKVLPVLFPCFYFLLWSLGRCKDPTSLTRQCWTASLRLFYCSTGSLIQAVFQSYVVIDQWLMINLTHQELMGLLVGSVLFTLHAIFGICYFMYIKYYDEKSEKMAFLDCLYMVIVFFFSLCGRVTVMAVVMATISPWWFILALGCPFLINYIAYTYVATQAERQRKEQQKQGNTTKTQRGSSSGFFRYVLFIPLALMSTITVSSERWLTCFTTVTWILCSLPQIIMYHDNLSNWLVWGVPIAAQVVAMVLMMVRWRVFKIGFVRFTRQIKFYI